MYVLLGIPPLRRFMRRVSPPLVSSTLSLKTVHRTVFTSLCSARSPSNPAVSFRQNKKRPKAFCFGGDGVCFAWNIPSAPFYAACFTAIGFFYALPKNSPQDCFYLALLGTVAFESRRLFTPKQKRPKAFCFGGDGGIRTHGTVRYN